MPASVGDHGFQQGPPNATVPMRPRNVKTPNATNARVMRVGIAIQSADSHYLAANRSHK